MYNRVMKVNIYKTHNNIERVLNKNNTLFLDEKEFKNISMKLKSNLYNVYYTYEDASRVILYKDRIPDISLIKINSYNSLKHNQILGSLMNQNIDSGYIGDIIIDNDNYYFYIFSEFEEYIINNLDMIGNNSVQLEVIDINYLKDYKHKYEELKLIVSSNRLDSVVSKIINSSRDKAIDKIKNKEVIVNYEVINKNSYVLKDNDIFSIRRYGKYKYVGVIGNTKSNNKIIKCLKYV